MRWGLTRQYSLNPAITKHKLTETGQVRAQPATVTSDGAAKLSCSAAYPNDELHPAHPPTEQFVDVHRPQLPRNPDSFPLCRWPESSQTMPHSLITVGLSRMASDLSKR